MSINSYLLVLQLLCKSTRATKLKRTASPIITCLLTPESRHQSPVSNSIEDAKPLLLNTPEKIHPICKQKNDVNICLQNVFYSSIPLPNNVREISRRKNSTVGWRTRSLMQYAIYKFKSCEVLFVHNWFRIGPIVLKFCTKHGSIIAVLCKI